MQNSITESICKVVKERDEAIVKNVMERKFESGKRCVSIGLKVDNIKPHILSDLCLNHVEHSIPSIKACWHLGERRY